MCALHETSTAPSHRSLQGPGAQRTQSKDIWEEHSWNFLWFLFGKMSGRPHVPLASLTWPAQAFTLLYSSNTRPKSPHLTFRAQIRTKGPSDHHFLCLPSWPHSEVSGLLSLSLDTLLLFHLKVSTYPVPNNSCYPTLSYTQLTDPIGQTSSSQTGTHSM